jgi:hypothetical protein
MKPASRCEPLTATVCTITLAVTSKVTASVWSKGDNGGAIKLYASKLLTCAETFAARGSTRSTGRLGRTLMPRCRIKPSPRHLDENVALPIGLGSARPPETFVCVFAIFFG